MPSRLIEIQTVGRIALHGVPSINASSDSNLIKELIHFRVRCCHFFLGGSG